MKKSKTLKKLILGGFFLLGSTSLFAQTQKVQTLQAKNLSTTTTMNSDALIQMDSDNKGLLLPRIALTGANQVAPLTAHTAGMVVYNTANVPASGTGVTAIEAVTEGYYYNNGTKWVKIASTDNADITDDAWVNNTTTNVVELGTKADGTTARDVGTEVRVEDYGGITIGKRRLSDLPNIGANELFFLATGKEAGVESTFAMRKYGYLDVTTYFGGSNTGEARLTLRRGRGTHEAPSIVQDGDHLGSVRFGASGGLIDAGAIITGIIDGTPISGKKAPAKITFRTANDDLTGFLERMTIKRNGNVGIGTETPRSILHVVSESANEILDNVEVDSYTGNNNMSPSIVLNRFRGSKESPTQVKQGDYVGNLGIRGYNGTELELVSLISAVAEEDFSTTSTKTSLLIATKGNTSTTTVKMSIKSDGKVGIGTATPTEKLEVNGTIKATKINFTGLPTYADDAAAGAGGLVAGDCYKTATGELRIKL